MDPRSSPPGPFVPFVPSGFSVRSDRSPREAPIVVLAGLTGVGKSELLTELAASGEQVLDLEALASHRGSAFGGIGLPPQPPAREFARRVEHALRSADPGRVLWIEDEGPFIGSVGLPVALQCAIASAPVVICRAAVRERIARLEALYADASVSDLTRALERSARRLGTAHAERAAALVERGELSAAIAIVLPYFDAAYRHRTSRYARRLFPGAMAEVARRSA